MLALNDKGQITECRAKELGNGRCNHVKHQAEGQSVEDFVKEINKMDKTYSVARIRQKLSTPPSKVTSGNFISCKFVKNDLIETIAKRLSKTSNTLHNENDRSKRNEQVEKYEKEFPGKVQEMFIVDRNHEDGKELHVLKNNGIIEIYNVEKFNKNKNSFITRLIARPAQISRYYKMNNCATPKYLKTIALHNEMEHRNYW